MATTFPSEFNIADYFLFDRIREGLDDKSAILFGSKRYSYGEVAKKAHQVSNTLANAGVSQEQRVYIVLKDTPAFAWSLFGALANGNVVAMGNPAAKTDALSYVINYSRCTALITEPGVAAELADDLRKNPYLKTLLLVPDVETGQDVEKNVEIPDSLKNLPIEVKSLNAALADSSSTPLQRTIKRDDAAVWLFTSGSTGHPKAAVHTHRDFAFNTEVYAKRTVKYDRNDITVSIPRLFFGYATGTNLLFPFAVGATAGLFSERPTVESLANAIALYRPTVVTNVPTMMGKLLNYDESLKASGKDGLDFSCVRFHLSAGEALPPALLERFMGRFGGEVYDGIGSAEMFHIYATNRPGDIKPGSLGRVVSGYEIKILAEDAKGPGAAELAPNETGVMWVKGDSVAQGYFQDRDKSWSTFHGHWCRTGDLFKRDTDGYFWFGGRADSLLKVSGQWVAPLELEQCITSHPKVSNAAVIGAKADGLTRIKAFVILRDAALKDPPAELRSSIQEHVRTHLTHHKVPRWICLVSDLPKNDRGKIDRKTLMERETKGENPWD